MTTELFIAKSEWNSLMHWKKCVPCKMIEIPIKTVIYLINRIIHRVFLELWNNIFFVFKINISLVWLRSLVSYQLKHSKINSVSPHAYVLFSNFYFAHDKKKMVKVMLAIKKIRLRIDFVILETKYNKIKTQRLKLCV